MLKKQLSNAVNIAINATNVEGGASYAGSRSVHQKPQYSADSTAVRQTYTVSINVGLSCLQFALET